MPMRTSPGRSQARRYLLALCHQADLAPTDTLRCEPGGLDTEKSPMNSTISGLTTVAIIVWVLAFSTLWGFATLIRVLCYGLG